MKDSAVSLQIGKWENRDAKDISKFSNDNKGKLKVRLGFIYFVVLVSSLIVLFVK